MAEARDSVTPIHPASEEQAFESNAVPGFITVRYLAVFDFAAQGLAAHGFLAAQGFFAAHGFLAAHGFPAAEAEVR